MKTLATHSVVPRLYKILTDHLMPFTIKNCSVAFTALILRELTYMILTSIVPVKSWGSVKSIDNHSSIVISNTVRNNTSKNYITETSNLISNTTFNSFFDSLITNSKAINKSAREIIYNASFNTHQINKAANVTHGTIAHASNNIDKITRNANRIIILLVLAYTVLISTMPTRLYLRLIE